MKKSSVSIIIPALNEERNIEAAIRSVTKAVGGIVPDYEIIVLNDGSTDTTREIVEKLQRADRHLRLISHEKNFGLGKSFRDGIAAAKKEYFTGFPGDNDMAGTSLRELIRQRDRADIVISYMVNPELRSRLRQIISKTYVRLLNLLFGLNLKYYNGYSIARTSMLQALDLKSSSFSIFAEIIIKMIKSGHTYREIPFEHTGRKGGASKAFSLKNIWRMMRNMIRILFDVHLGKSPVRD